MATRMPSTAYTRKSPGRTAGPTREILMESDPRRCTVWKLLGRLTLIGLLLLGACSTSTKPSGWPCETCRYRIDPNVSHDPHPQFFCFVGGHVVDCKKLPPECPECAKKVSSRDDTQQPK